MISTMIGICSLLCVQSLSCLELDLGPPVPLGTSDDDVSPLSTSCDQPVYGSGGVPV